MGPVRFMLQFKGKLMLLITGHCLGGFLAHK
jgi:hypothetical protein